MKNVSYNLNLKIMKKTFTLFTALLISAVLLAQTKLSITTTGNLTIRVMVDGKKYQTGSGTVMINDLKSGNHSVKIFRQTNERNRGGANNNGGNYQLVYSKNLFVKANYHVDITVNRFGKAFVDEQVMGVGYNDDDDDWGVDNNDQYFDRDSRRAMDNNSFEQFKQSISNETFASSKIKMAKQVIGINYVTAAQVKEIVSLMSFDDNKLDIAKYAYDYTVDKGNYFLVNDAFSFSKSKEALMDYIKTRN